MNTFHTEAAYENILHNVADDEERCLALAIMHKNETIAFLVNVARYRKERGEDDEAVLEGVHYEELVRAGYQRALDKRRAELRAAQNASAR